MFVRRKLIVWYVETTTIFVIPYGVGRNHGFKKLSYVLILGSILIQHFVMKFLDVFKLFLVN
jgi:hypothetical protein